jgi:dCMP deaminase
MNFQRVRNLAYFKKYKGVIMKRNDYLSWENTFILMSDFISNKSKMPIKKGACLVSEDNLILSLGYNGLPKGIELENLKSDLKLCEVSAIVNSIIFARRNLKNTILYTTHFPTEDDTKYLIQNGIKKIYYIDNIDENTMNMSYRMLKSANISVDKVNTILFTADLSNKPTFEEIFIGLSNIAAFRSKDPSSQVGACIADKENRIISIGYNGLPFGCSDDDFPWNREGDYENTKYPYVVHAEPNAIAIAQSTSPINLAGSSIYVNLFPCNRCATKIIQCGINKVIYVSDKYKDKPDFITAREILEKANVEIIQRENVLVELK